MTEERSGFPLGHGNDRSHTKTTITTSQGEQKMFRELQEYVFGQKPIRRQNPTLGQSEWYYMDPRGTENFSDMKTIDVANSESPNPYAAEIKADLYKNAPTNYKILFEGKSDNNRNDEALLLKVKENLERFEGKVNHPYLDSKGLMTIGYGTNIDKYDDFKAVNFLSVKNPEQQKKDVYNKLKEMSESITNYSARAFEDMSNLRISDDEAWRLSKNHIQNDLKYLREKFADFDTFPEPLREVLIDIKYNTGNLAEEKWPNLYSAIKRKDVLGENGILKNILRKNIQEERNRWAEDKIRAVKF